MSESEHSDDVSQTDVSLHSQMGARPSSPRPLPMSAHRIVMAIRPTPDAQPAGHLPTNIGGDNTEADEHTSSLHSIRSTDKP